jgi:AbrB family looped-hinge helix DNA binding protein
MSELRERVRVGVDGRVSIPKPIRQKLGIKEGSTILEVYPIKENKIVMEVLAK